jgi:hypothetical protein
VFLSYLFSSNPSRTPIPPSRPRCETADEPYLAGYEDRMAGNGMSVHATVYMTACQCVRCSEYRAGWHAAHEDRIGDLDKARKRARKLARKKARDA